MSVLVRCLASALAASLLGISSVAAGEFSIEPEAVYMKFSESRLPFAVEGELGDTIDDGSVVSVGTDYDLGYRIGLGYSWEGWWDINVRYTHLDTRDRGRADDASGALWATTLHPMASFFDDDEFETATAEQDLDLDYLDIVAGKTWNKDNGGSIRLFFGARVSWFDQDSETVYSFSDTEWEISETWLDWKGLGPLVGFEGHVPLGEDSGWSFFGSAAGSLQFGDSDGRYFDVYVPDATMKDSSEIVIFPYENESSSVVSVLEFRLGFAWEERYERTEFGLRFGYEYQAWDGLANTASLIEDAQAGRDLRTNENFDLHGFFFRLGWTF